MKFAIVDLGSNTIRLSVYNTLPEGGFDLLFSEKEMAGLVSYVHGGVLSPEGIQRACGAIRDFQALLRQLDLDAPHVFATASLRNKFAQGDAIELVGPDVRPVAFTAPMMADETGALKAENGNFRPDAPVTAEELRRFLEVRLGRCGESLPQQITHGQFFLLADTLMGGRQ